LFFFGVFFSELVF